MKDRLKEIWVELKFKFTSMYPSSYDTMSEQWLKDHSNDC